MSWFLEVTLVELRSVWYLVSLVKGSDACLVAVISSGSSVLSSRLTLATLVYLFLDFGWLEPASA